MESKENRFILVGLHTCGDLAPTLLRVYTQSEHVAALASMGCCYMKLTTTATPTRERCATPTHRTPSDDASTHCCIDTSAHGNDGPAGYPMSYFVREECPHLLSYEARELACHALDVYRERLDG